MPTLFDPITLRGVDIRNRVWVAPMCQYSSFDQDGVPTDWHLVHLGAFAQGGAGLVIAEATAVTAEGRISPHDTGIWNDEQRDAWKRITAFIESQGAVPGIQLAHAGRKASTYPAWGAEAHGTVPADEGGWPTVSASDVPFGDYAAPRELTRDELPGIVEAFREAAVRARDAGFRLIEIHAAHGYLLHQFLSPLSNLRDDEYGGSLENRARLVLEVTAAVREELGEDFPVFVRFSATDWADDGWDVEQTATVAGWAREAGADLFDISTGGLVTGVQIPMEPGYQVAFAADVKHGAEVATSAIGLIITPQQADDIVQNEQADAIMLARAVLRDPHWPLRAAHELGVDLDYWPPQYLRGKPTVGW